MNTRGLSREDKRILREAFIRGYKRAYYERMGMTDELINEGFLGDIGRRVGNYLKGSKGKQFIAKKDLYTKKEDLGKAKRDACSEEQQNKIFGETRKRIRRLTKELERAKEDNDEEIIAQAEPELKKRTTRVEKFEKQWQSYCKLADNAALAIKRACVLSRRQETTFDEARNFIKQHIKAGDEYEDYENFQFGSSDSWERAMEAMANCDKSDEICSFAYHLVGKYYLQYSSKKKDVNAKQRGADAEIHRFLKMHADPTEGDIKKKERKEKRALAKEESKRKRGERKAANAEKKAQRAADKQAKRDAKKAEKEQAKAQASAGSAQVQPETQPAQQTSAQPTQQTEPVANTKKKRRGIVNRVKGIFGGKNKKTEEQAPQQSLTTYKLTKADVKPNPIIKKTNNGGNKTVSGRTRWLAMNQQNNG